METFDKWFAIVNPVAGSGKGLSDWPLISKLLRDPHIVPEYAFTERKYHAIELAVEAVNNGSTACLFKRRFLRPRCW